MHPVRLPVKSNTASPIGIAINKIIKTLGIEEKLDRFPKQLSGGEQQRVAIARSLITRPAIILGLLGTQCAAHTTRASSRSYSCGDSNSCDI